ncbi:MAG: hypothetical protein ABIU86_07170 [Gemmatimonadaceae bacterium]
MKREDFVGWLGNRDRQPWSLAIPYEMAGQTRALFPDFIIFRERDGDTIVDIVDPHLVSLEDAPLKSRSVGALCG